MSDLANLLNPAPSAESTGTAPVTNGSSHTHHDRNQSITSPLENLALAATSSPPLHSPTHPVAPPFTQSTSHQRSYSSSSSRPGSSHISLPMPHALAHPSPTFSPNFDSHAPTHHHIGSRKPSVIASGMQTELPPLRPSVVDSSSSDLPTATDITMTGATETVKETPPQNLPPLHDTIDMIHTTGGQVTADEFLGDQSPVTSRNLKSPAVENDEAVPDQEVHSQASIVPQIDGQSDAPQARNESLVAGGGVPMKREDSVQSALLGVDGAQDSGPVDVSQPVDSKKRSAAKSEKKVEKKGIVSAIKKPAAKKRKLDADSTDGTPFSRRSGTPTSSRASKTPAPRNRRRDSGTPVQSSPAPASKDDDGNDDDDADDDRVYCICRKPDDHTWMIGCDGGCDEWFHGRCVDMNERDGNLIDKYICPNCKEKGVGVTTWKPMCRLETCREPARVTGSKPSKYCCDEHGEQYMARRALGKDAKVNNNVKTSSAAKRRRKDNITDNIGNDAAGQPEDDAGGDQAYLRGGILRAGELKALTSGIKDVQEFKRLGEGVLSPASPDDKDLKFEDGDRMSKEKLKVVYTTEDEAQLTKIASEKTILRQRREALGDRERFLNLVKSRAKSVLEELKRKDGTKDICGFDPRLSWSDEEFETWRMSNDGKKALESGILGAPMVKAEDEGEEEMVNGYTSHGEEIGKGACQKKRCERHKQWFKLKVQEIGFEKDECRQAMRKLEAEEKGLRERAMVRHLEGGEDDEVGQDSAKEDVEMRG